MDTYSLFGSVTIHLIFDINRDIGVFLISLVCSSVLGLFPLVSMLLMHHLAVKKHDSNLTIKLKMIVVQTLCYLIIFSIIPFFDRTAMKLVNYLFALGAIYLLIGFILTLVTGKKPKNNQ